ncbi:isochorismatase family protein [Sphingomonas sp. T9W2]|uniref:isochorismatase family protein n=1 Tax=Sphingomonas sp. T9W2 TaxID=3143183 RepID=UPI0031F533CE
MVIIDMQQEMQARIDAGRPHVHGDAPTRIAALVTAFRHAGQGVVHVRHAETDPASPLHPDAAGYPPMLCTTEAPGEPVFVKHSSSAFATTDLANHLRAIGSPKLYVVGAVAEFCVNSTVRAAVDLGFLVEVVADAVLGFDLPSHDAQTIFDVTMALLAADFAKVTDSAAVITSLHG